MGCGETEADRSEIAERRREGRCRDGRRPLTAKIVARLKGEGRYRDGFIPASICRSASEAPSPALRYEVNGQPERWMGLGSATIFGLAERAFAPAPPASSWPTVSIPCRQSGRLRPPPAGRRQEAYLPRRGGALCRAEQSQ